MMNDRIKFWFPGVLACVILAGASVWLGGLNQDEGWYLYAANLVAEGKMLYRDFFYTQGPLLPIVYSPFKFIWENYGLLGARIFTSAIGIIGIVIASRIAGNLVSVQRAKAVRLSVFILLACNLYHIYYVSIPKTYALAALTLLLGFWFFVGALKSEVLKIRYSMIAASAALLAFSAGARISLCLFLPVCGLVLLLNFPRYRWSFLFFGLGGVLGVLAVYGAFVCDCEAFQGLLAAQKYHAAREGFSPVLIVGCISRLVRWYSPIFIVMGLAVVCGGFKACWRDASAHVRTSVLAMGSGALVVALVQIMAPCPYDDYQVPIMGLVAVVSVAAFFNSALADSLFDSNRCLWLMLGMSLAISFGSPLLQEWMSDGQDRFWVLTKKKPEIALLRDAAREVERLDPNGKRLLTQDVYLAVETGRKVPDGLEMGPFSILSKEEWRKLLLNVDIPVAALSGYTFAIDPPVCNERSIEEQLEFWNILKSRYSYAGKIDRFGQNSTTLLFLELTKKDSSR